MRLPLLIPLLVGLLASSASAASLADYLPKSEPIVGRVMQMAPSAEAIEIVKKIQAAAVQNLEWFIAYSKQHDYTKGNLPYHPKLGVTEAEWARFGVLSGQTKMQQIGTVSIRVTLQNNGNYLFSTVPESFPLNGASVAADLTEAETRYGRLNVKSTINQNEANSMTGRWHGIQWKREEFLSDTEGLSIKFAVGRRTDFDDGIIYYDVKNFVNGSREVYHFVVLYPIRP